MSTSFLRYRVGARARRRLADEGLDADQIAAVVGPASDALKLELNGYPFPGKPVYVDTRSGFAPKRERRRSPPPDRHAPSRLNARWRRCRTGLSFPRRFDFRTDRVNAAQPGWPNGGLSRSDCFAFTGSARPFQMVSTSSPLEF